MLKSDNIGSGSKTPEQQDNCLSFQEKIRRCSEAIDCGKASRSEPRYHFLPETEDGEGISLDEDKLKSYLKNKKITQHPKQPAYLTETEDGFLVRVPFDNLDSWVEAQHSPPRPLTTSEKLVCNRIVTSLYGQSSDQSSALSPESPTPPSKEPPISTKPAKKIRRSTIMFWILSVALVCASTLAIFFAFRYASLESALSEALVDLDRTTSMYESASNARDYLQDTVNHYSDEIDFWRSNVVAVTEFGEKYHTYGCRYIKDSDFLLFLNIGSARLRGYEPCSVCYPA